MAKITKLEALVAMFSRIANGREFAMGKSGLDCTYYHPTAGGCAIGIHLPKELAIQLDELGAGPSPALSISNTGWSDIVKEASNGEPCAMEAVEMFEDPKSEFWPNLQRYHDRFMFGPELAEMALQRAIECL